MQEKSAVGSATGFMGDLGLRQLLDGAQLVLNRGPRVFPPPARCGRRLLPPTFAPLSQHSERAGI